MKDYELIVERQEREVHVFVVDPETNERIARLRWTDALFDSLFPSLKVQE